MTLPLSVIISTYNIERYNDTVDVLNSLLEQSFNKFEIIVVVDENKEYYKKLQKFIIDHNINNINIIFNPVNLGLSYSRNLGLKCAKGNIVAYLDDDVIATPDWAKEVIKTFRKYKNIGAVAGHILPLWKDEAMNWFPEELYWMISCSYILTPKRETEVDRGFGANMAFKKDLLLELGGFREDLGLNSGEWVGGEDTDIFLRIREKGYRVIFNPKALVYHKIYPNRIRVRMLMRRAFGGGKSIAIMRKRYNYIPIKESNYIKVLLRSFYIQIIPNLLTGDNNKRKKYIKQLSVVTLVILSEGIGYIIGSILNS